MCITSLTTSRRELGYVKKTDCRSSFEIEVYAHSSHLFCHTKQLTKLFSKSVWNFASFGCKKTKQKNRMRFKKSSYRGRNTNDSQEQEQMFKSISTCSGIRKTTSHPSGWQKPKGCKHEAGFAGRGADEHTSLQLAFDTQRFFSSKRRRVRMFLGLNLFCRLKILINESNLLQKFVKCIKIHG